MMNSKEAFRLVRYLRSISKGNKQWQVLTYDGETVIRVFYKDTYEIVQWNRLNSTTIKAMIYDARYMEV